MTNDWKYGDMVFRKGYPTASRIMVIEGEVEHRHTFIGLVFVDPAAGFGAMLNDEGRVMLFDRGIHVLLDE